LIPELIPESIPELIPELIPESIPGQIPEGITGLTLVLIQGLCKGMNLSETIDESNENHAQIQG